MVIAIVIICVLLWVLILLGLNNPLMNWDSYKTVFRETWKAEYYPFHAKYKMYSYLVKDALLSPVHCLLWQLDEFLYGHDYQSVCLNGPVFIISQPRSGSTMLHRLLADDDENFFGVTYLEWHWPYICVWKFIDYFKLRNWINNWNYWPDNHAGNKASRMHPHVYGDHEEHGVFLEEKFYHHYFVFRRFPFRRLLLDLPFFTFSDEWDKCEIMQLFKEVVKKVHYYRGRGRTWVTKENESVDFYQDLFFRFPEASFIFLVRDYEEMLSSYITLSRESTLAKTGVDMARRDELWHYSNLEFRRIQCLSFCNFYQLAQEFGGTNMLVNYNDLVSNPLSFMLNIYEKLGLEVSPIYYSHLVHVHSQQKTRRRDYLVSNLTEKDKAGFYEFEKLVKQSRGSK